MKLLFAFASAVAAATIDASILDSFAIFMAKYNKHYEGAEYATRVANFAENMEKVRQLNEKHVEAVGYAVFGMTKFSDLSDDEFRGFYLNKAMADTTEVDKLERVELGEPTADSKDWRNQGVLTAIKNQEQCGSCWAFSATEAIESFAKIAGDELSILSPQQIVSCDKTDGGCNGGWPYKAFEYVRGAGGMETNADYPYTSGTGRSGTCEVVTSKFVKDIKVTGHTMVNKGESNLAAAVEKGPVSIAVDASQWSRYSGGVLSTCGTQVDHAVQAVGFTADYWIVRNSWGTNWGEDGFIRIKRGEDLCMISDYVSYPNF